jgi:N utilization substance protein A
VPNDQLSLAIGREGQNARLAARLTGFRIDLEGAGEETKPEPEPKTKSKTKPETKSKSKTKTKKKTSEK